MSPDPNSALQTAALAYLPRVVREALGHADRPARLILDAVVWIADVQGFTALTERLAGEGSHGAEVLAERLNARLGAIVDAVLDADGDVLTFAGDAVMAMWTGHDAPQRAMSAANTACSAGDGQLAVKVMAAEGVLHISRVGGNDGRWELLVAGPAMDALAALAPTAVAGTVVASAELLRSAAAEPSPVSAVHPRESLAFDASGWIPLAVVARLRAGQAEWLAEMRRVTTLFVALPGLDAMPTAEADALVAGIQRLVHARMGTVNKLSVDEKGPSLLAAFGAPPHAQEDDPQRAVHVAMEAQNLLTAAGHPIAIGVATGRAFCGELGNARRREYTLLGDAVNTAARLMAAAKSRGGLLVDEATRMAAAGFRWHDAGTLQVKGKRAAIHVFTPEGHQQNGHEHSPLVGRANECERLRAALGRGHGAVLLMGEAGVGKSRLLHELSVMATRCGFDVMASSAESVAGGLAFAAWRGIFDQLLGSEPEGTATAWLAADTESLALLPLLNALSGTRIPETELTAQLRGESRVFSTARLGAALLRAATASRPMIVILDGATSLDSGSLLLAERVVRAVHTALIALAMRPLSERSEAWERLLAVPNVERIEVQPLDRADVHALFAARLGRPLSRALGERAAERAGGSPLFAEAIADALREDEGAVPDSVRGVLQSRLDRLPAGTQLSCKLGSVVGYTFALDVLRGAHAPTPSDATLREDLAAGEALALPVGHDRWTFRQPLVRDVLYDLLLVSQRREVHARIAGWHENITASTDPDLSRTVGHHWWEAGDRERAAPWLGAAGVACVENGTFEEGARLLELALQHTPADSLEPHVALRHGRWYRLLGEARYGLGRHAEARVALEHSLVHLGDPVPATPARLVWGTLTQVVAQWGRRLGWYRAAQPVGTSDLEAAQAFHHLAPTLITLADMLPALYVTFRGLELAESHNLTVMRATGYASMILVVGFIPLPKAAEAYCRLAAQTCPSDRLDAALYVDEATAIYRLGRGEWDAVRIHAQRALATADRIGDRRRGDECLSLLAAEAAMRGELDAADRLAAQVVARAEERGDVQMMATWSACRAECALARGDLDSAARHVAFAGSVLPSNAADPLVIRHLGAAAMTAWRSGDAVTAAALAADGARRIGASRQLFIAALEGYAGVAEVVLALWEADERRRNSHWRTAVSEVMRGLKRMAAVFPPGEPRLWIMKAKLEKPGESRRRAAARAVAAATRLGMPRELAEARELGGPS